MCPPGDTDLSPVPGPVAVTHDRQPDHARLSERAEMREAIEGPAACVVVSLPRDRAAGRDRIARAAALGVRVLVDGQKNPFGPGRRKEASQGFLLA